MRKQLFILLSLGLALSGARADSDSVMKAMVKDGGHISNTDKDLFSSSVRSTKSSIARDMMESFYLDAVDLERSRRYDEALDQYEKILSIDPEYKDAHDRRENILKRRSDTATAAQRRAAQDYIRKGDTALTKGLTVQAIAFWKQALDKDPANAAAQKKITDANKGMARRQFEAGYIHYKHNEMEDALDAWQNAIAFDPSLKNRGLLLLMAKVELGLRQQQLTRLANQGYDQYQAGDLLSALRSYEELLAVQPRHDEGRRMSSKIKIQLGRVELAAAKAAAADKQYAAALERYQASLAYDWEPVKSQDGIKEMTRQLELAKLPPPQPKPKAKAKPKPKPVLAPDGPDQTPPPAVAVDAKAARDHYRAGLQAIRNKDYQRAVEELQLAQQLDATDERIYMALQRAKQEWQESTGAQ